MDSEFLLILFLIVFLSAGVTIFLTPLTRRFSIMLGCSDRRNSRTVHRKVVTRLGGIAIYAGISLSLLALFLFGRLKPEISALFAGLTVIFIIGIIDDIREVSAYIKLLGQLAACLVVIHAGFRIFALTMPFAERSIILPSAASYIITITWLLLITNAVNFIDGLDGLAAGIMTIACFSLFGISLRTGNADIAALFLAVAGTCLGFLRYNFHPAKVFMGDAGSTTIGFTAACLTLFGTIKAPAVFSLFIPLVALGIPATDVCFAVIRRLKNRRSPFSPDKKHLHHKLLETGLEHRDAVLVLYGMTIILGIVAFTFSPHPSLATGAIATTGAGIVLVVVKLIGARRNNRRY